MFQVIDRIGNFFVLLDKTTFLDELVSQKDLEKALKLGVAIDSAKLEENGLLISSYKSRIIKHFLGSGNRSVRINGNEEYYNSDSGIKLSILAETGIFYIPSFVVWFEVSSSARDLKLTGGRGLRCCDRSFLDCCSLHSIDLSELDMSNVTDTSYMFYNCMHLKSISFGNNTLGNNVNMSSMFHNCRCIESLDLSNFDTYNIRYMGSAFCNCMSLKSLDLSNFDISNVQDWNDMFTGCRRSVVPSWYK